jgi:glycosyltransferase involved in cell wall biosynthesis
MKKFRDNPGAKMAETNKIRIMRIIARMNVGGPAVQITGLMRNLDTDQFVQRLYTGYCGSEEVDYLDLTARDIEVFRIPNFGRRVSPLSDIKVLLSLVMEIRRFKPHIIHTHTSKAGLLGRIASIFSLHRSIRVHTFHGHLLHGYFGKFKESLIIFVERILALVTHKLLAVGNAVRDDLLNENIGNLSKFEVMPPGIEIGDLPYKSEALRAFGLDGKKIQCAFIGRVTQIKRPDRFLNVVKEIKTRNLEVNFFIAGDGDEMESCQEVIRLEDLPVTILSWQTNIERVLAAADIVLLTSDNEGMPVSLIQAGMAGLPVVATNVGSVGEVVLNNTTGFITSLETKAIADAIEKLLTKEDLRKKFGVAAHEFTRKNFSVQLLVRRHENLYRKMLPNQAIF